MERRIIHLDMDAFFAAVEQRDRGLGGHPLVVGGTHGRGVVAAASYESRMFGIRSAMPMAEALRRCPDLLVVPPHMDRYREEAAVIREVMLGFAGLVEPVSIDEAYLDVSDRWREEGSATAVAVRLKEAIRGATGLTSSAGVGPNKTVAKIASGFRKPDGLTVVHPLRIEAFFDPLPIERFPGIGEATASRMLRMGIKTGFDLRRQSITLLRQQFGKSGDWFYRMIRGEDPRPVSVSRRRKSVSSERTFFDGLRSRGAIESALEDLAERVHERMERVHVRGRTVTLKVRFADFSQFTRSHTAHAPCSTIGELRAIALHLSREIEENRRVRLLGLGVSNLEPAEAGQIALGLP